MERVVRMVHNMRAQLIEALQEGCTEQQAIERMTANGIYHPSVAEKCIRVWGVEFPPIQDDTE